MRRRRASTSVGSLAGVGVPRPPHHFPIRDSAETRRAMYRKIVKSDPDVCSELITVLPMQLQPGDRITDESGEWEVVGRPYTTAGGKNAQVRLQRVDKPGVTEMRMWGAYERIAVKRGT